MTAERSTSSSTTCPQPFTWTATANEIITKVRLIHQDFKKLLDNKDTHGKDLSITRHQA